MAAPPAPSPAHNGIIDVWDVRTFDEVLRADLDADADLIRNYLLTSHRLWEERQASDHTTSLPDNPYAGGIQAVKEHIMRLMGTRTIRAWHYTRLTDAEADFVRKNGVYPSSLDNIRSRFSAQVAAGVFTQDIADRLFADSPYQSDQRGARVGKFWMVSQPAEVEDGGVNLLLQSWGGEAAYFWQRDPELQELLKQIGRPRVLEIAMPLAQSRHAYPAAEAVVATYGRTLGCRNEEHAFDLYSLQPLGPAHILALHSRGDLNFEAMARSYPAGFLNGRPQK